MKLDNYKKKKLLNKKTRILIDTSQRRLGLKGIVVILLLQLKCKKSKVPLPSMFIYFSFKGISMILLCR